MKNKRTLNLVQGALIAALYVTMTYLQEVLLPGTTSFAVQFRFSEILCIFAIYSPCAIYGLTIGCVLSNIISIGVMPLDILFGAAATLFSAICMYKLRNVRLFSLPVLSSLMPVIFNAVIVGLELEIFYIEGDFHISSFLIQSGLVAIGEFAICVILGLPFSKLIEKFSIYKD